MLLCLVPAPLLAHSLGESYGLLRFSEDGRALTVTYNLRRDQFLQLADLSAFGAQAPLAVAADSVREGYEIFAGGEACERTRFAAIETELFFQASFVATCSSDDGIELRNHAFFDLLPDHLHFLRVSAEDGAFIGERVLDRSKRSWMLPVAGSTSLVDVARRYAVLGIDHMLGGYDHLAFLASVLLLVGGWKALVLAITGFTLGHSVTLALAVLGLVVPNASLVEALIGMTIALVAAESVFRPRDRLALYAGVVLLVGAGLVLFAVLGSASGLTGPDPLTMAGVTVFFAAYLLLSRDQPTWLPSLTPLVTGFFGLIHGFGFAGSLAEIGLPVEQLATALVAFNVGIEVGQLIVVAALLVVFAVLRRVAPPLSALVRGEQGPARTALAGALVSLGTYWFVGRAFV